MDTIAALLSRKAVLDAVARHAPERETLSGLLPATESRTRPTAYEVEVFNLLLARKESLGIRNVVRLRNVLVDGEISLSDSRVFVIEVKLRMNWAKACLSGWQISQALARASTGAGTTPPSRAIVFFEEFSGDWARTLRGKAIERGWRNWYEDHAQVDGLRIDLMRIRGGVLEGHPLCATG